MLVSLTGAMCGPNTTIQTKGSVYTSSLNLLNITWPIWAVGNPWHTTRYFSFSLVKSIISIVLCLNTKYLINTNLDMGIIQHGEFLPMLRYHDMHMALLSVHYGFITRVSKSSSSNLYKSVTFGDECLYKNTHGNNVIYIYLPANTTFYNLMTTLSMSLISQSCTRVYTTTVHNVALS